MKSDFDKGCISISDAGYPDLLKNIYDPPEVLHFKGNKELLKYKNLLTIVGSRKTTAYHRTILQKIIADLKDKPIVIVSGLAVGIDGLSHRYALESGLPTIAVLGSCLDWSSLYPQDNLGLAKEIIANDGLLLSEQAPGEQTQLWHFPRRNRILAGLSRATLVVSGAKKSGTLITAQVAIDESRDVFALPANINLTLSQGPNQLIKNGAQVITSANDILKYFNLDKVKTKQIVFKNKIHAKIYSTLQTESLSLVELAKRLSQPTSQTNILVSELELQGLVQFNQFNQIEIL